MAKLFNIMLKLIVGIVISGVLTAALVIFTPGIFSKALNTWVGLLPDFKYVHSEIQTKEELAKSFGLTSNGDDAVLFEELQATLPNTKDKSSLFFMILGAHSYPEPCKFTLIGMHRTINISWRIEGLRCKGKEACELARTQQICPDKKKHEE